MQFQWLTCLSVVLFHNVALSMNVSPKHLDLRQATPTTAQAKSSSIVDTHTQVSTRSVSASASTSVSSSSTATPSVTVTTGPSCTQTVNPDKNGHVPPGTCHAYFEYYPSFEAAFLFSILFGITTIIHIGQAIHYRKAFCWVITMGAAWELVAFITRTLLTRHQQNTWLALTSNLLILLAPLWINAFAYMVLARMIYFFVPERALFGIRASTFALIFVSLDIFSFLIQFIGGAMASPTAPPDQQLRGFHVYMAGISFQELLILMFLCLVIKFHVEWCKLERAKTGPYRASRRAWWLLYGLYIILGLITIRIVFRLAEYYTGRGRNNPIPYHEAFLYVFDAVAMLSAILMTNIIHPGTVLLGADSEWRTTQFGSLFRFCGLGEGDDDQSLKKKKKPRIIVYQKTANGTIPVRSLHGSQVQLV